uniref:C-type lectin domain-containing protein n=1 Tax=Maylandia zebra TaxID=106582 RepID=A0A3P9BHE0_9CICH
FADTALVCISLLCIYLKSLGYIYCVVTVPNPWYSYSCYMHNAVTMTWADAELHCVSEGTNLVSIHGENVFTWIGLGDIHKEGRWMWSDGSQVSFELWGQGKETCAHINFDKISEFCKFLNVVFDNYLRLVANKSHGFCQLE